MTEPTLRGLLTTGRWSSRLRWAVRIITPWGIEFWLWKGHVRRFRRQFKARLNRAPPPPATRYEAAIRFLAGRGLDEFEVREGSMPESTLEFVAETALPQPAEGRALRVLHIGNFVGVSLAYLSLLLAERDPSARIVSIDPNITHRGIERPQEHVSALLDEFGVLGRNLIVTGYTLERGEPPGEDEHRQTLAPEHVLAAFADLGLQFDLVLVDGDHEREYLERELAAIAGVLVPEGVVVLDDVQDWPGVREVFTHLQGDESWTVLGENGRAAVVRARLLKSAP